MTESDNRPNFKGFSNHGRQRAKEAVIKKIMKDNRKQEYAGALIRLMTSRELKSISVREICQICGTHTQNFYYHYKDKYDLVEWIYRQDIVSVCAAYRARPWREVLELAYEKLLSKRAFYRNAFRDDSTNALIHFVVAFQTELYKSIADRYGDGLNEQMDFMIRYHSLACAEVTRIWLTEREPIAPGRLAEMIMTSMPDCLRESLNLENRTGSSTEQLNKDDYESEFTL